MRVSPSCLTIWRSCVHGLFLVTDYTGGGVFPTGASPWRVLKQIFLLGCLRRSYSPKCLEVEFCELRHNGVLRSSFKPGYKQLATRSSRPYLPCSMGHLESHAGGLGF